jgi:hypothetical protein
VISDKEYNSKTDVKIEKGWIKEVEMIMVSNESAVVIGRVSIYCYNK